jgi:hypothetical protein
MVRRVQESGVGGADSDLGGGVGPADEQLVRIETGRVVRAQGEALVVMVAGEIDLFTVERFARCGRRRVRRTARGGSLGD